MLTLQCYDSIFIECSSYFFLPLNTLHLTLSSLDSTPSPLSPQHSSLIALFSARPLRPLLTLQ